MCRCIHFRLGFNTLEQDVSMTSTEVQSLLRKVTAFEITTKEIPWWIGWKGNICCVLLKKLSNKNSAPNKKAPLSSKCRPLLLGHSMLAPRHFTEQTECEGTVRPGGVMLDMLPFPRVPAFQSHSLTPVVSNGEMPQNQVESFYK